MAYLFNFDRLQGRPAPWLPPPLGKLTDAELVASMRATRERVQALASRPRPKIAAPPPPAPAPAPAPRTTHRSQTHERKLRSRWKPKPAPATPRPVAGPPIMDRDTALKLRLGRFNSGRPCKRGHYSRRRVSDGACIECDRERSRRTGSRSLKYRTLSYPSLKNPFPR